MEWKHLETFLAVSRRLSFTRAAKDLGYVQSSVTAHIKSLEADLDVALFERLGRQVRLTEAGQELRRHAQDLINQAEHTRQAVQEAAGDPQHIKGTLRVAAPESLCAYLLPPVLRELQDRFPRLRVVFGPAARDVLITSLGEGSLDVGFLLEETITAPMAAVERLADQPLQLVARPGHPLATHPRVATADLTHETLLLIEPGCAQREVMDRELRQAAIHPVTMEFVSIEALKRCAAAGLGIAMLPAATATAEIARGELVPLPWTTRPVLGIHVLRHKNRQPSTVLTTLSTLAHQHWG